MIVVTGATGRLGRHVVDRLLRVVPSNQIAVAVRNPEKAADFARRGVAVRVADYNKPPTVEAALAGAAKVLLISSSEVGQRVRHHRVVVDAARKARVEMLAYTSILRADTSRLAVAIEHRATEQEIRGSDIPHVFLRHGWYLENYTERLQPALNNGAFLGCAAGGRVAGATRADYAAADVAALTAATDDESRVYELGGDASFTMADLAAEISRQSGKTIVYQDLRPEEYRAFLLAAGFPSARAEILVDADVGIARGELEVKTGDLRRLLRRPPASLADAVAAVLFRMGADRRIPLSPSG